jgi:hypothetical protein
MRWLRETLLARAREELELPLCGARCRTRRYAPCRNRILVRPDGSSSGKCRMHGGLSTGPRTSEGRARCLEAARRGGHARAAQIRALRNPGSSQQRPPDRAPRLTPEQWAAVQLKRDEDAMWEARARRQQGWMGIRVDHRPSWAQRVRRS